MINHSFFYPIYIHTHADTLPDQDEKTVFACYIAQKAFEPKNIFFKVGQSQNFSEELSYSFSHSVYTT